MDGGPGDIALDANDVAPKPPVGVNAKKAFTENDETRNVKNGIWCELVKLHTVNKKKSTNKFMDRKREAADETLGEHYLVALLRVGHYLLNGHHHLCGGSEEPGGAKLVQVGLGEGGCHPPGCLLLL
jgi:hypothetical protein